MSRDVIPLNKRFSSKFNFFFSAGEPFNPVYSRIHQPPERVPEKSSADISDARRGLNIPPVKSCIKKAEKLLSD